MAAADDVRLHADSLTSALAAEQARSEARRRATQAILSGGHAGLAAGPLEGDEDGELQVFAQRIAEQQQEIGALQAELEASNAKRAAAAKVCWAPEWQSLACASQCG